MVHCTNGLIFDLVASFCSEEGTAFIDIGANVGVYTFSLLSRFPRMKIFAFKPNPKTFGKLLETKSMGNYPTLHLIQSALGDAHGTAVMKATDQNSGCSTLGSSPGLPISSGLKQYSVPVVPFDAWWDQNIGLFADIRRFIIKIDVEGFEPQVVKGMAKFLTSQNVLLIVVEFFELTLRNAGNTSSKLFEQLIGCGFTGYTDREFKFPIAGAPPAPNPINVYFRRNINAGADSAKEANENIAP